MAARKGGALARVPDEDNGPLGEIVDPAEAMHVLRLGEAEFVCAEGLPMATLIRYANNNLLGMHHILVKLVHPDEHEAMWDEFEKLSEDDSLAAISDLIGTYSKRPTKRPSSSRGGSRRTRSE